MKTITSWFVLTAPFAVLAMDALVFFYYGYEATITAVVREWAEKSSVPEILFLLGCVILYSHLFRNFP